MGFRRFDVKFNLVCCRAVFVFNLNFSSLPLCSHSLNLSLEISTCGNFLLLQFLMLLVLPFMIKMFQVAKVVNFDINDKKFTFNIGVFKAAAESTLCKSSDIHISVIKNRPTEGLHYV